MNMLTLYPTSRADSDSSEKNVVPPGVPYLTKVNGKLVMARAKRETPVKAIDLLGEAFGIKAVKVAKKRSQSISALPHPQPSLISGVPYVAQGSQAPSSTPIPQGPFTPSLVLMPPYDYQHSQLTYAAPFNAPAPAPQQFENLRNVDEYYNKYVVHQHPRLSVGKPKEDATVMTSATKTTITVIKHICANCGRLRSRKYHKDHPITPGETPAPEFCGRCQRDVSDTESENEAEMKMKKKKSKSKPKRKGKKKVEKKDRKHGSSSSDQESSGAGQRQKSDKKGHSRFAPSHNIITVVQEISDEDVEQTRRGRSSPQYRHDDTYQAAVGSYVRLRPSSRVRSTKPKETKFTRARSRTPEMPKFVSYRVVEAPRVLGRKSSLSPIRQPNQAPDREPDPWNRRGVRDKDGNLDEESEYNIPIKRVSKTAVPIHFADKKPEEPAHARRKSYESTYKHHSQRVPSRQSSFHEPEEPLPAPPRRHTSASREQNSPASTSGENSFESVNSSSSRFSEARQRRRRERIYPPGAPHVLRPQNNEPVIVVTEKYVYRPKREVEEITRQEELEEERRQQQYADKAVLGSRYERRGFSAQGDAERYYKDDWARYHSQASTTRISMPRRRRRHGEYEDSSVAESESTNRTDATIPPKAPSPPSPPWAYQRYNTVQNWNWQGVDPDGRPYPLSSEFERTGRPVNMYDSISADDDYYNRRKESMPGEFPPPRGRSSSRTDTMRSRPDGAVYENREHRGRSGSVTDTVSSRDTSRRRPEEIIYENQEHRRYSPNALSRQPNDAIHESQEQRFRVRGFSRDTRRNGREENIYERQEEQTHSPNEQLHRQFPEEAERVEIQVRSKSRSRPVYVRKVTGRRTEKALPISPHYPELYDNMNSDQSFEPSEDKHVTFRESVSERKSSNCWDETDISGTAACMKGWGGSQLSGDGGGSEWMRGDGAQNYCGAPGSDL